MVHGEPSWASSPIPMAQTSSPMPIGMMPGVLMVTMTMIAVRKMKVSKEFDEEVPWQVPDTGPVEKMFRIVTRSMILS